jgi:DNA repair exonuclease SbcCD nuclease subunit
MIEKINIGIDKIDKIYHIADVHIRNLKRHQEYKTVFGRTVESIKSTITANDVIFLGGDIVHAKTDMTPELIQAVQEFFKQFADIAPVILIAGNHDMNLNNKSRLDALTPIVNAIKHPNLYYIKDSGLFQIADKIFIHLAVDDKPVKYLSILESAKQVNHLDKIILHHGAVDKASTDIGFCISNDHVSVEMFNSCNPKMVLLGDIHKPNQSLQEYQEEYIEIDESEISEYLNAGWQIEHE